MDVSPGLNPFVYSRPLRPDEAIPRTEEVAKLLERAEGGHNATVIAPRRYGKTCLLKQLIQTAERRAGMVGVLVDLSDILSPADLAGRLQQTYRALKRPLARFVEDRLAGAGIATPLGGVTLPSRTSADPFTAIHTLLDLPLALHERTGKRVLVTFDEFQSLLDVPGLDGVLRSHLQHHSDIAAYIFSGSEPSMLRELFENRARPFYGQAELIQLEPLAYQPAHTYLAERFRLTGRDPGPTLPSLIRVAQGHPQRLMLLAHHLWEQTPTRKPAGIRTLTRAYEAAMRQAEPELQRTWEALTPNERRALRAIASGISPYAADAAALTGLSPKSSAQSAVKQLTGAGLIHRGPDQALEIADPLLERWARRRGGARPTLYVVPAPGGGYHVTDGPSLAFIQTTHPTIDEAERAAEGLLAATGAPGDLIIYDEEDPNDLPEWALP